MLAHGFVERFGEQLVLLVLLVDQARNLGQEDVQPAGAESHAQLFLGADRDDREFAVLIGPTWIHGLDAILGLGCFEPQERARDADRIQLGVDGGQRRLGIETAPRQGAPGDDLKSRRLRIVKVMEPLHPVRGIEAEPAAQGRRNGRAVGERQGREQIGRHWPRLRHIECRLARKDVGDDEFDERFASQQSSVGCKWRGFERCGSQESASIRDQSRCQD